MGINHIESYLQKLLAIGGRATSAIRYIEKGQYQKVKTYLEKIVEISNEEIDKIRRSYGKNMS